MTRNELVIVGIDPGTTSAAGLMSLDGELVNYTSRREFSKDRIIQFIVENGKPLIVASDVFPAPSLVEEIASNTGSVLLSPDRDLEADYKDRLVSDLGVEGEDSHIRDALASAEYARREYEDKLEEIEKRVREEGVWEDMEDVVELVIKGSLSISQAVKEVKKVDPGAEEPGEEKVDRDWERIAEKRKDRIDLLEGKIDNLEKYIGEDDEDEGDSPVLPEELEKRNRTIQELREELELKSAENDRLKEEIDRLREGIQRLDEGWVKVPKVEKLADSGQEAVYVESYSGGEISGEVKKVISPKYHEELSDKGILSILVGEVERKVDTGDSYIVHPEELETEEDTEGFMEWLESYQQR